MNRHRAAWLMAGFALLVAGCGGQGGSPRVLATFPLDDLGSIMQKDDPELSIDKIDSFDGHGSLHVQSQEGRVVRLFEVAQPDVDNCLLTWSAHIRSASLFGDAYLEMWCRFPGGEEYFSRGLDQTVQRTTDWTEVQTSFRLEKGQKPDRVRLNLKMEGGGHIWIDDAKLAASPLPRGSS
jgi:hypothetical protein